MTSDSKKNKDSTISTTGDNLNVKSSNSNENVQKDEIVQDKKMPDHSVENKTTPEKASSDSQTKAIKKNQRTRILFLLLFIGLISIVFIFKGDIKNKFTSFKIYVDEQYFKKNNDETPDQKNTSEKNLNQEVLSESEPIFELVPEQNSESLPTELIQQEPEKIFQPSPTKPKSTFELQEDSRSKCSVNDQVFSNGVESENKRISSNNMRVREKIQKQRYINILEEISRKIVKLNFNSSRVEAYQDDFEPSEDSQVSEKLIHKLLSLVKITRVQDPEFSLPTNDFYLIVREQLKLRLLSAKVIFASNLDISPLADLAEASFLLEKYFLNDSVSAEIKESLKNLIEQIDTKKFKNNYPGE